MNFSRNPQTCYSTRPSDARATPGDHQCRNERRWEDRTLPRAEVLRCGKDEVDLAFLLEHLSSRGIRMALVEGGSTVIWSFLRDRLADELRVFISSRVLGGHSAPTVAGGLGVSSVEDSIPLRLERSERLGDGILLEYTVVR